MDLGHLAASVTFKRCAGASRAIYPAAGGCSGYSIGTDCTGLKGLHHGHIRRPVIQGSYSARRQGDRLVCHEDYAVPPKKSRQIPRFSPT